MKELIKLTFKNAELKDTENGVFIREYNSKDEFTGQVALDTVYEKIKHMDKLKLSIGGSSELTSEEVELILNQFIGKYGLNITIQNEEDI